MCVGIVLLTLLGVLFLTIIGRDSRSKLDTEARQVRGSEMVNWDTDSVRQILEEKGWRRNDKKRVANRDLWVELMEMCDKHDVRFEWVKGHAGHPENERCDQLALAAAQTPDLSADEAYERESPQSQSRAIAT